MDELLQQGLGSAELVIEILGLRNEEGMEAVDSFEFEMEILNLLHSRFHVYRNNCIEVFELS